MEQCHLTALTLEGTVQSGPKNSFLCLWGAHHTEEPPWGATMREAASV